MKLAVKPNQMKLLLGAAGILGLVLRAVLYTAGVDPKGLLIRGYWAGVAVWLLTAAVAAVLLLWCRRLAKSRNYQTVFPASVFSAAGAALAGIAFALSPVSQAPSDTFASIESVMRFIAAGSLICVSYCRFRGKAPLFLCHSAVCLYLALRLVCQYRIWSADPQLQNYVFYMGTHVALMITAYQFAAFDAGYGSHRKLWAAGLAGTYLSVVSVAGSDDPFFLICCALWVLSNLSRPTFRKFLKPYNPTTQEESQ